MGTKADHFIMDKLLDSFLKSLLIELALDDLDKLSAFL
jgi:hypothetical protein